MAISNNAASFGLCLNMLNIVCKGRKMQKVNNYSILKQWVGNEKFGWIDMISK